MPQMSRVRLTLHCPGLNSTTTATRPPNIFVAASTESSVREAIEKKARWPFGASVLRSQSRTGALQLYTRRYGYEATPYIDSARFAGALSPRLIVSTTTTIVVCVSVSLRAYVDHSMSQPGSVQAYVLRLCLASPLCTRL